MRVEQFTLHEEIGHGSRSTIYRAVNETTQLNFAIKVLSKAKDENKEYFDRECATMKKLQHQYVTKLIRTIEDNDNFYIVMEYCKGGNLKDFIKNNGPLSEKTVKKILSQLLIAIDYFHSVGVFNPNISPKHILLDSNGDIKLTGFGHAQLDNPLLISPEFFKYHCFTPESDVWALGVLLYYAITSEFPFVGESPEKVMVKVLFTTPKIPETVSPFMINIIASMLAKEIDERITIQNLKNSLLLDRKEASSSNLIEDKLLSETHNSQRESKSTITKRRDSADSIRMRPRLKFRINRASSMDIDCQW